MTSTIRFEDGAGYERAMGAWSRLVGAAFLDWLAPATGLRWLDVGCGNGAFTELLAQRCAPAELHGIDPSSAQLSYARSRPALADATFEVGDAMALPYASARFEAAVSALVVVFLTDPATGVAEMVRVTEPGGLVASYMWDMTNGGFPFDPVIAELQAMGVAVTRPPSVDASRSDALQALWSGAGLENVAVHAIEVQRSFADFGAFWETVGASASIKQSLAGLSPGEGDELQRRVRERVGCHGSEPLVRPARAFAIRGTRAPQDR